jgi:hypothetical protein
MKRNAIFNGNRESFVRMEPMVVRKRKKKKILSVFYVNFVS